MESRSTPSDESQAQPLPDYVRDELAHYEEQTEDDALVEDEAGMESSETVMNVPHDLVPKVRELIAKRHS